MVARAIADEIARLLAAGAVSQRTIAAMTTASRGTVAAIKAGTHWSCRANPADPDDVVPPRDAPKVRCVCGALTSLPCIACRDRQRLEKHPLGRRDDNTPTPIIFDLQPDEDARRREVRAAGVAPLPPANGDPLDQAEVLWIEPAIVEELDEQEHSGPGRAARTRNTSEGIRPAGPLYTPSNKDQRNAAQLQTPKIQRMPAGPVQKSASGAVCLRRGERIPLATLRQAFCLGAVENQRGNSPPGC